MSHKFVKAVQRSKIPGFRYGMRQPTMILSCNIPPVTPRFSWVEVDQWLVQSFNVHCDPALTSQLESHNTALTHEYQWCVRVMALAQTLFTLGGVPIFEQGRILSLVQSSDTCYTESRLAITDLQHVSDTWYRKTFEAASIIITGLTTHLTDFSNVEPLYQQLERQLIGDMWKEHQGSITDMSLLEQAFRARIPWRFVAGVYQLGWGTNRFLLRGSQTQGDSHIGRWAAGHKYVTAKLLKKMGLPVPQHRLVTSEEQAREAMRALHPPVVVKPVKGVGGQSVIVGIQNESQLVTAFNSAKAINPQVLVEEHIAGVVHHIQVDNNRVAYVLKRNPVGVRGNGVLSIRALIDEENSVRKKALLWQRKMPLPSDEEAIEAVKQLGFSFDSVPPNGVWVPLRKLPNNTDGSRDEDLSSRIHPDNIALVLRATSLLGLSWASIDVISPDISIPWYQNGAVINEVNNAPMIGAGSTSKAAIPELLKNTLNDAGRIPIECFVGGEQAYAKACSRQQTLASQGQGCVLITHSALEDPAGCSRLGNKVGLFKLTLGALLNKRAEALILVIQTDELLHTGLPVDRVSQVVWVDEKLVDREHAQPLTDQSIKALKDLLENALVEQREGAI